jgi:hypothetical protein
MANSNEINILKPILKCKVNEPQMVVNQNENFDLSLSLIDAKSETVLNNITWTVSYSLYFNLFQQKKRYFKLEINFLQNYRWSASITLFSLPKCRPNGSLANSFQTTNFNVNNGKATFSNILMDSPGMYLFHIKVKTIGLDDYDFDCLSKPVIVKRVSQNVQLSVNQDTSIPNFYFNFSGNYDALSSEQLEQYKSIFYNCIFLKYDLVMLRSLQIYKGSIILETYISGAYDNLNRLKNDLSQNGFSLTNGVDLRSAEIFDQSVVVKQINNNNNDDDDDEGGEIIQEVEKLIEVRYYIYLYF